MDIHQIYSPLILLFTELVRRRAAACLAAVAITVAPPPSLFIPPVASAAASVRSTAEPSADSQAVLRKAFSAAQAGLFDSADAGLSTRAAALPTRDRKQIG